MRSLRSLLALAAVAAITAAPAMQAQAGSCTDAGVTATCSIINTASVTVGTIVQLDMDDITTSLTAPTLADFAAGFHTDAGPQLTVKANATWTLSVAANTATWTSTGSYITKPAGDLLITPSSGTPVTLSTSSATLSTGSSTASTVITTTYKNNYSWTLDTPGDYSLAMTYTITAP